MRRRPASKRSSSYPVRFTVDQRPALYRTPVPCLPVCIFGFQGEPGIDYKMQRRLVLKTDLNCMALAGGENLDKIHRLAFDLLKAVERASTVAAHRGLAAFGFGEAEGGRQPLSLLRFFGVAVF